MLASPRRAPARRLLFAAGTLLLSVLSCGREPTGVGEPPSGFVYSRAIAFNAVFPEGYAEYHNATANQVSGEGGVVEFDRVRIVLRFPDGSIAIDTIVMFPPPPVNEISVPLSVPLPASAPATGIQLQGGLTYQNGTTPIFTTPGFAVPAVPATPGATQPPAPVVINVPVTYVGPGATATTVTISPKTLTVNTGASFSFNAVARDASGNIVPSAPVVFSSSNPAGATIDAVAGSGTAGPTRGTVSISARLLTAGTPDVAVLTIVSPPSSIAAVSGGGQTANVNAQLAAPVIVQVNATDGQPASGVAVTFAAQNGGTVGAASVTTGSDGRAQTTWRLGPNAGAQTLTASASGLTGSPVTFSAAAVALPPVRYVVATQPPASVAAGASFGFVVNAVDALGAVTPGFTGAVTIALASAGTLQGTTTVNAVAGVATFSGLSITTPGTYAIAVSGSSLLGVTTNSFAITAGAANRLAFQNYPIAGAVAGTPLDQITVVVRDAIGNTVTSFTGPITISVATGPAGATILGTATVNAVAGVASFNGLSLTIAGAYTLRATSTGLTEALGPAFAITAGPATALALVGGGGQSALGAATLASPIVVKAADAFGNGIGGRTVTFTPVSGSVSPTTAVTAANGQAQTSWTLGPTAGVQTLNVSSAGLTPNPLAVTATATTSAGPGPAALLSITQGPPPSTAAGTAFSPSLVVTAKDANNQTATSFTGNVTLAITANPGGGTLSGTVTVAAVAGVATFPGLSINKAGNGYSLTASSGTLTTATTLTFNIVPAAASVLAMVSGNGQGGTVNAALAAPFVAKVSDAFGNPTSGVSVSWAVLVGGGSLSGTTSTTDAAGQVQTLLTMGSSAGLNTVQATSAGLAGSPLTFTANSAAGAATKLAFVVQPSNVVAGVNIAPPIVVQAHDAFNNLVTSYATNVALTIATNPGAATLGGVTSGPPSGGQTTFGGVSLDKAGVGYTLTATSGSLASATSSAFNVTAAAATSIAADSGGGQSALAGAALPNQIVGRVVDSFGNPVAGVSVTWGTPTLSGSLGGTTTTTDANGRVRATWTLGGPGPQSVTLTSAGLAGSPVTFSATGVAANASKVWTGAQDAVWTNANNWSPPGAPAVGDSLLIQAGGIQPSLSANTTVKAVYIADGATLNLSGFTLTVTGNMSAGNTIVGNVDLTGTGTMQGHVTGNVNVTGTYTVVGPDSVGGALTVGAGGSLTIGANIVGIAGNFSTTATGVLVMATPGGLVNVHGDASFGGGASTLANGIMQIKGGFAQTGAATTHVASGAHQTVLFGGTPSISFSDLTGTSRFNVLKVIQGTTTISTDFHANAVHLDLAVIGFASAGMVTVRDSVIDPNDRWGVQTVNFTGPSVKLGNQLGGATTVRFKGGATTTLLANALIAGSAVVENNTTLVIGDKSLGVGGTFTTGTGGRINMTNGSGALSVTGAATFGGGNETGLMSAGVLTLSGNLTQTNGGSGAEFAASSSGFNIILTGGAAQTITFADPDTASGACTKSCLGDFIVNKSGGSLTLNSGAKVVGNMVVNAGLTGLTSTGTAPVPKPLHVAGTVTTDAGVTVSIDRLVVGGAINLGAATTVDTIVFAGTGQAIPARTYQRVMVKGSASLAGNVTANLPFVVDGGALTMNGKTLTAMQIFATINGGTLIMNNAADVLDVAGAANFFGGASTLTNGTLKVRADFQQGVSPTAFAATAAHTTSLLGTGLQSITMGNADLSGGASCLASCFGTLTIGKASGSVGAESPIRVLGDLMVGAGITAFTAVGDGEVPRKVMVDGNVTTAAGTGVNFGHLTVKGNSLSLDVGTTVDTMVYAGSAGQPVLNRAFNRVVIKGSPTVGSTLTLGNFLVVDGGTFNPNGHAVTVQNLFATVNGGVYAGSSALDSITTTNVDFAGGLSAPSDGRLVVTGNLMTAGPSFQATGNHTTIFTSFESTQTITGSAPVAGQGLHHVLFVGGGPKNIAGSLTFSGDVTIDLTSQAVTGVGANVAIGGTFTDYTTVSSPALRAGAAVRTRTPAQQARAQRADLVANASRALKVLRAASRSAPRDTGRRAAPPAALRAQRRGAPAIRAPQSAPRRRLPDLATLMANADVGTAKLVNPLGGWQVENTTISGTSISAEAMTTNLLVTGATTLGQSLQVNGDVAVAVASGSPGQFDLNGFSMTIDGDFSTATGGKLKIANVESGMTVLGSASFAGGSTAGLLTDGYIDVLGNFAQGGGHAEAFSATLPFTANIGTATEVPPQLRSAPRGRTVASVVAPSQVSFANPGEGAGTSHFGDVYFQGPEIELLSNVVVLGELETGVSPTIHIYSGVQRAITSHGADVRNLTFDLVRWELLDGAAIGSMDYVTFNTMDPTVSQFAMTRNGALPPLCDCSSHELWNWSFNTVPTTGNYIKAEDTDGATNGVLTIRMQSPNPTSHGGHISLVNGSVMQNWVANWVWTGTSGTNWSSPGNWGTLNSLPDFDDNVTIPSGTPNSPQLSSGVSTRNLTIASGAVVDLDSFGSIAVHGDLVGPTAANAITCSGCEGSSPVYLVGTGATHFVSGKFQVHLKVGGEGGAVDYRIGGGSTVLIVDVLHIDNGDLMVNGGSLTVGSGGIEVNNQGRLVMTNDADQVAVNSGYVNFLGAGADALTAGTLTITNGGISNSDAGPADSFTPSGTHKVVLAGTASISFWSPGDSYFNDLTINAGASVTMYSDTPVEGTLRRGAGASTVTIAGNGGVNRFLVAKSIDFGGNASTFTNIVVHILNGGTFTAFNNITFLGNYNGFTNGIVNVVRASGTITLSALNFSGVSGLGVGGVFVMNSDAGTVNVTASNPATGIPGTHYLNVSSGSVNWP